MGIGASVFLIAVGAILTFATDLDLSGLDLDTVGIILMVVGVIGLLMTLLVWAPRGRATRATRVIQDRPVVGERPVVEERRMYDDSPPL